MSLSSNFRSRFEEVEEEEEDDTLVTEAPKESKKRARESDVADDAPEQKLSKKEKKKLKKLKAENGEAIPVGDAKSSEKKGERKKEGKADKKEKKLKLSEPKVLAGGVKIAENKVGEGAAARPGNRVSVRYVGKLQNGTIFDSNTKGKPVCTSCIGFNAHYTHAYHSSSSDSAQVRSSRVGISALRV